MSYCKYKSWRCCNIAAWWKKKCIDDFLVGGWNLVDGLTDLFGFIQWALRICFFIQSTKAYGGDFNSYLRPVLAFGCCSCLRLSVCLCVCIDHLLGSIITHHPFKQGSPKLDQKCKIPWLRSLFFNFLGECLSNFIPHFIMHVLTSICVSKMSAAAHVH